MQEINYGLRGVVSLDRLEEIKGYTEQLTVAYGETNIEKPPLMRDFDWLIKTVEEQQKTIKDCIRKIEEGGAGTRSQVLDKLRGALKE